MRFSQANIFVMVALIVLVETFMRYNVVLFKTFSCLGTKYMFIYFRPTMIGETYDRNLQNKNNDLIDKFA